MMNKFYTTNLPLSDIPYQNKQIIIVGEKHGLNTEYDFQYKLIKEFRPDFLLHEILINLVLKNKQDKLKYLDLVRNDVDIPECEPMYPNLPTLELINRLDDDLPCIGIDYTPNWKNISPLKLSVIFAKEKTTGIYKQSFSIRESRMLYVIKRYMKYGKRMVVVVGDTHLRTIKTKELGDISPIHKFFAEQSDALIIRSNDREID